MSTVGKTMVFALLAFTLPVAAVAFTNWDDFRPYLIGDPYTATGELLFFTAPG